LQELGLVLETSGASDSESAFPPLPIRGCHLERGLGSAVSAAVGFYAKDPEDGADLRMELARVLASDSPFGTIVGPDGNNLTPKGAVIGVKWDSHGFDVQVDLQFTAPLRPQRHQNPHVPRWRVLRASNMGDLITQFPNAAQISKTVKVVLQNKIQFGSAETPLIQAGLSDWQMLDECLKQSARYVNHTPAWWPLMRLGDVKASTHSDWLIESASAPFHDEYGDLQSRMLDGSGIDGTYRMIFSQVESGETKLFRTRTATSVGHYWAGRTFDQSRWKTWFERPLPQFLGDADQVVWSISDYLYSTKRAGGISWDSRVNVVRSHDLRELNGYWNSPRPWIGRGFVVEYSEHGPSIKVQLPGFEEQRDGHILTAFLTTPYSGRDSIQGLHFTPELNTMVALSWSGLFGDPVLVLGNVREQECELPSPSLSLDRHLQIQSSTVQVHEVDQITVASKLQLQGEKSIRIASKEPLELEGEDGKATLKQGQFKTGRG
jgi:hypothetical protein